MKSPLLTLALMGVIAQTNAQPVLKCAHCDKEITDLRDQWKDKDGKFFHGACTGKGAK